MFELLNKLLSSLFRTYTLCSVLILFCVVISWKYIRLCYYLSKIPGPTAGSIIATALLMKHMTKVKTYSKVVKKYGSFYKVWIGFLPTVVVIDPNILQTILKSPNTLNRGEIAHWILYPILRDTLIIANGETWKQNRKLFNYAFSPTILNSFVPIFNGASDALNRRLKREVGKTQAFNVRNYLRRAALDSILAAAMSIDVNNLEMDDNESRAYSQALDTLLTTGYERVRYVWTYPQFIFNLTTSGKKQKKSLDTVWNLTSKVFEKKLESMATNKIKDEYKNIDQPIEKNPLRKPFLDFLLDMVQAYPIFTTQQLKEEINSLIIAAYETTPATLSYVLLVLGARQDIQQKVYDEISTIFGNSDRPINLDDLPNLKYTEMVIKETLRLYPAVAHTARQASADIDLENCPKNYKIPAGTYIIIPILEIHRNPKYWDNPMEFNPERFLTNHHHKYAFIPFTGGQRNCIGARYAMMLMKIIVVNVLRKYEIHTPLKLDQLKFELHIGLQLSDGHLITIKER